MHSAVLEASVCETALSFDNVGALGGPQNKKLSSGIAKLLQKHLNVPGIQARLCYIYSKVTGITSSSQMCRGESLLLFFFHV